MTVKSILVLIMSEIFAIHIKLHKVTLNKNLYKCPNAKEIASTRTY